MPFRHALWLRLILPNLEDAPRRNPGGAGTIRPRATLVSQVRTRTDLVKKARAAEAGPGTGSDKAVSVSPLTRPGSVCSKRGDRRSAHGPQVSPVDQRWPPASPGRTSPRGRRNLLRGGGSRQGVLASARSLQARINKPISPMADTERGNTVAV